MGSYLQNRAPYVEMQHLGKRSNATEVKPGQPVEGSLSKSNISGTNPPKQINLVKDDQRCYLCLAAPNKNNSNN